METTIKRVKTIKIVKEEVRAEQYAYYELDGAVSEHGVPFGFVKDWLIKMR